LSFRHVAGPFSTESRDAEAGGDGIAFQTKRIEPLLQEKTEIRRTSRYRWERLMGVARISMEKIADPGLPFGEILRKCGTIQTLNGPPLNLSFIS
jgi:hypothetical protein